MFRWISAYGLTLAVALHAAPEAPLGPLTAEELFHAAEVGEARISPDGKHLGALVADDKDLYNLLVYDLKDYKPSGLRASGSFEVSNFHWLGDDRVLFSIRRDKVYSWGLFSARLASLSGFEPLDKYDVTQVIGLPRLRPGRMLVWITQSSRDLGRPGDLLELDADRPRSDSWRGGAIEDSVVRGYRPPNDEPVVAWECDRMGELATCTTWSAGSNHLYRYLPISRTWAPVPLAPLTRAMAMDFDNRYLWVVHVSEKKAYELCRMNIETGAMEAPVLTDPVYDIGTGHLYFSDATKSLAGVTYVKRGSVSAWFDGTYRSAQVTIDHLRPGTQNVLLSSDRAERKFLFRLGGPEHPASYELLDLDAKTLRNIVGEPAFVGEGRLRPVQSVSFATRDGARLEGYLALPPGAGPSHPVPLVVLVHGGPKARDTSWFDPVVQFLATRGYAVFQPNYRGSTGYSPAISHEREFDFMRMHEDVTDATKAILGSGMIDRNRVAIMGSSFGGYLAVSGVAFDDGLYRCAISECGVFDWERHIKSKRDVARPGEYEILTDELGMPGRDSDYLEAISPINHADKIRVPVLIAHGTDDNVVDVSQSKKLVRELQLRGVPCETFYRDVGGHGFFSFDDRVAFYHKVEAFLAANIGGATLTLPK